MGRIFHVRSLSADRLHQALPLAQALAPGISLAEWVAYVRSIAADESNGAGIASAQGEDGYIYGLFCHKIERDLQHGRVLSVDNFVVLDLVDHRGAADILLAAIDRLALQYDCACVHMILRQAAAAPDEAGGGVLEPLQQYGHEIGGIYLLKRIDPQAG